jgi:diguanylate cyclase (GGDEF)-like protein
MISIRLRIILLAIFSIAMVVLFIYYKHVDIQKNVDISNAFLHVVDEVSHVSRQIHSLQIERGLTATYLSKRNAKLYEKLLKQYKKNNNIFEKSINYFGTTSVVNISTLQENILQVRNKVKNGEATWLEVKSVYTLGVNRLLLRMTLLLSELEHSKEISHQLYALIHLAKARENLGLLRANISRIYQRGKINREELLDISNRYDSFTNEYNSFYFHIQRTNLQDWQEALDKEALASVKIQISSILKANIVDDKILVSQNLISTWWSETTSVIDSMKVVENNVLKTLKENANKNININNQLLYEFIFKALIILSIIAVLTITTVFRILQALSILIRSMNQVEETQDFGVRVQAIKKDEFGQLGFSINKLLDYTDQILKEKEKLASFDLLTGVMNRRSFFQIVEREVERSERYNTSLSLIFCDIDKFKSINDKYGHAIGDKVLHAFANLLQSQIRSSDYIARWGGEEFVILVCENSASQVVEFAEKLRKSIMSLSVTPIEQITCSFGVAQKMKDEPFKQLLERADVAVYEAKKLGRNKVCFADEEVSSI